MEETVEPAPSPVAEAVDEDPTEAEAAGDAIPQRVPLTEDEKAAVRACQAERKEREIAAQAQAKIDAEAAAAAGVCAAIEAGKIKAIKVADFEVLLAAAGR